MVRAPAWRPGSAAERLRCRQSLGALEGDSPMRCRLVAPIAVFVALTFAVAVAPAQPRLRLFRRGQPVPCPCDCPAAPALSPAAGIPQGPLTPVAALPLPPSFETALA